MIHFLLVVLSIIAVIFLFSLAVFIHEFGHFLAARALGMQVDCFSIGFGPAIWKKKIDGVEYRVSWILFGGYVALPQLDPAGMEKVQGDHGGKGRSLPDAEPWKRIVVAVAGPFGNIVLAVVLALLLAAVPWARFAELGTEVGSCVPETPAAAAGVRPGERVVSVNGHATPSWYDMKVEVQIAGVRPVPFVLAAPDGSTRTVTITPVRDAATGVSLVGLLSAQTNAVRAAAWMPARNPLAQLRWDTFAIVRVLKALVTPKESGAVAKSLGGPVLIATSLYTEVRDNFWDALGFLRFLCINLALLNLLPLPVLDGGHVLFAFFEIIFRRKPNRRFVDFVTNAFGYLLIALMLLLVYTDVARIVRVKRAVAAAEAEEAAATNSVPSTASATNAPAQ